MTTTVERPAPTPAVATTKTSRWRRWAGSWRAALRLARRDALRHKGASLLIMILIGLPVMIISGAAASLATGDVSARESLPVALGNAQALITDEQTGVVTQAVDGGRLQTDGDTRGRLAAGSSTPAWTAEQVARLTGGTVGVAAATTAYADLPAGPQRTEARIIGRAVLAGSGLAPVVSGRLPAADGEIAVTPTGVTAGLPSTGPLQLRIGDRTATVTVVGVVATTAADFSPIDVVLGEDWLPADEQRSFLVLRDRPVDWAEVQRWNTAGLSVISRAVVLDPPRGVPATSMQIDANSIAIVVLVCLGLVLETALLAGPAFAVSASRRRRSLALIASNGAEQGQLTRYVVAQGVILGGAATLAGSAVGTVWAWAQYRLVAWAFDGDATTIGKPPLDTSAWVVGPIVLVAFLAAVISAAVPGRRAARLDIADGLAGRMRGGPVGRGLPLLGGALMIAGVARCCCRSGRRTTWRSIWPASAAPVW